MRHPRGTHAESTCERGRRAAVFACAALALAACASPAPVVAPHPYRVVLMPVEGARAALEETPAVNEVPLAMSPEGLEAVIRERILSARAFSEVVAAEPADLRGTGLTDSVAAAAEIARRSGADLVLRVNVKSARMTDLGNNGSTFWSTLTWTLLPLPLWLIDDRTYATDVSVQAELYDPAEPVKPAASILATSGRQDLDLWDRGPSFYVLIVPPAFLKGDPKSVSQALTERAVAQLLDALVQELRTRDIPSRFDLDVTSERGVVEVAVASRRKLRAIEVFCGGRRIASWVEARLVPDPQSAPDRFVYRRSVEAPSAAEGATVRVVAEDEVGGHEVRTVLLGGAR